MSKAAAILVFVSVAILVVVGYRYEQFVLKENYTLIAHTACNPMFESCFAWECDPLDTECDQMPFKKVEVVAHDAPQCLKEHTCEKFLCEEDSECTVTYCSQDVVEEGEKCLPIYFSNSNL